MTRENVLVLRRVIKSEKLHFRLYTYVEYMHNIYVHIRTLYNIIYYNVEYENIYLFL